MNQILIMLEQNPDAIFTGERDNYLLTKRANGIIVTYETPIYFTENIKATGQGLLPKIKLLAAIHSNIFVEEIKNHVMMLELLSKLSVISNDIKLILHSDIKRDLYLIYEEHRIKISPVYCIKLESLFKPVITNSKLIHVNKYSIQYLLNYIMMENGMEYDEDLLILEKLSGD